MIIEREKLSRLLSLRLSTLHRGKENTIKRKDLLNFARYYEPKIEDRELRKIYSMLPVACCSKGIFWPVTEKELLELRSYFKKKAIAVFLRWNRIAASHPEIGEQRYLWAEDESWRNAR